MLWFKAIVLILYFVLSFGAFAYSAHTIEFKLKPSSIKDLGVNLMVIGHLMMTLILIYGTVETLRELLAKQHP